MKAWLDSEIARGVVSLTPAGINADPFLLDWADKNYAIVISNDMFREFEDRYPWLSAQGSGRCVTAMFDEVPKRWTFMERRPGQRAARPLNELLPPTPGKTVPESPKAAPVVAKPAVASPPPREAPVAPAVASRSAAPRFYRRQITRDAPLSLVFLLDQSGSMATEWRGGVSKAARLAAILNDTLRELVITSTRMDGVRPYFYIAALGYGGKLVRSLLPGSTLERPFRSITDIHENSVDVEEVVNGRRRRRPVYVEMHADGLTPMCEAFTVAEKALRTQVALYPKSFPPIVINISDGEPNDGDPEPLARRVAELSTEDGNVLVFNAHIAKNEADSIRFPSSLPPGSSAQAGRLFRMSSPVPDMLREKGAVVGFDIPVGGRGVLVNASPDEVVMLLNVGTLPTTVGRNEAP